MIFCYMNYDIMNFAESQFCQENALADHKIPLNTVYANKLTFVKIS